VRVDVRQFEQVIMNLVVNARDAMTDGGEVRIRTRNVRLEQPLTRDRATVPVGDYALVQVIDAGSGIPPDKIGNIFEPFYTTKKIGEGTGLGLSTAYGIIKQTGGFIFADSEPGAGATFSIYLPRHLSTEKDEEETPAEGETSVSDLTGDEVVLLVEDEAPVRSFASRALKMRGYTVFEAESAEAALDLLKPQDLHIDVIVSDVVMPGMDGPTWVRDARETRPDVKVIFVSGYAEEAFQNSLHGMDDFLFLPKPYTLNELTQAIRTAAGDDLGKQPRHLH
jgi:two-component system cell cycle sensor histidine kinase/response regulator CckA